MLKRCIVVGASGGIGSALVRKLAGEGYLIAAIDLNMQAVSELCAEVNATGMERAWPFEHDVTDTETAQAVFDKAVVRLDGLDAIIYAAGVMPRITEDDYDTALDRLMMEVNTTGAIGWLNPAATRFRLQGRGSIVAIGSCAGDRGRRGQPVYCASKAALHTYLESLRNRLAVHGVHVLTIKPGPVHTPLTAGLEKLPMAIEATKAADLIFAAMARRADVAYIPLQWAVIMSVIKTIPSLIFRRMSI